MKCDVCHEREAVHEIDGWRVCADAHCKYRAWLMPPKEIEGEVSEERKDEL